MPRIRATKNYFIRGITDDSREKNQLGRLRKIISARARASSSTVTTTPPDAEVFPEEEQVFQCCFQFETIKCADQPHTVLLPGSQEL